MSDDQETLRAERNGMPIPRLTAQMAKGVEPAWEEFHERYFSRLLRFLCSLHFGDEEAARESLQKTYLRVVKHVRRFDDEMVFWSWLTRVGRTVVIDGARKSRRYSGLMEKLANIAGVEQQVAPAEPGLLAEALQDCLARCPQPDRGLLEKKYVEQWSYAELATELNTTPKAVESRLGRLRSRLKECILNRIRHA